jgi:ADP-heptose:LPS heptosyltransferase
MAAGQARKLHKSTGLPVMIVGRDGRPRWSELWNGVPYIIHRAGGRQFVRLMNGPNVRPYVAGKTLKNWTWRAFKPTPAEIVFTPEEKAFAEPYRGLVMIEPNVKAIGHDNKAWLAPRWLDLVKLLETRSREAVTVQCVPPSGASALSPDWITTATTPTFRHALAVLSVAKAFVGTEGGLMHGAAAVGTPAVILWSEFISPEITGYSTMTNLRHAGKPCGNRLNCLGCRKSMEAITVTEVIEALEKLWESPATQQRTAQQR